jgi:two-component system OmpR family response regulator
MRLKIFLVEDNPLIRQNLIELLEELAWSKVVGWAATEQEASDWLLSHPGSWELAVVDLFLREGSGLGVLKSCVDRSRDKKLIVLSNYINVDSRERCLAAGADAIFDKSQELEEFAQFAMTALRADLDATRV